MSGWLPGQFELGPAGFGLIAVPGRVLSLSTPRLLAIKPSTRPAGAPLRATRPGTAIRLAAGPKGRSAVPARVVRTRDPAKRDPDLKSNKRWKSGERVRGGEDQDPRWNCPEADPGAGSAKLTYYQRSKGWP